MRFNFIAKTAIYLLKPTLSASSRFNHLSHLRTQYLYSIPANMSTSTVINSKVGCLVDFDANLLHKDLCQDLEHHVRQAQSFSNVHWFVVPGSTLNDSIESLLLARSGSQTGVLQGAHVIATAGVHPYHTNTADHTSSDGTAPAALRLREIISAHKDVCKAVGECGLDYSEGFPSKDVQIPWFRIQVELALELRLPLYFHVRKAREDFVRLLREAGFPERGPPPVPCVVHCFTGDTDELQEYLQMGFHIGLTGYVLGMPEKLPAFSVDESATQSAANGTASLQQWLQIIPRDKLVIETDAPYMGFKGCRGTEDKKKNQKYPNVPASLRMVCDAVSRAGDEDYLEVAQRTTSNALAFFGVQESRES